MKTYIYTTVLCVYLIPLSFAQNIDVDEVKMNIDAGTTMVVGGNLSLKGPSSSGIINQGEIHLQGDLEKESEPLYTGDGKFVFNGNTIQHINFNSTISHVTVNNNHLLELMAQLHIQNEVLLTGGSIRCNEYDLRLGQQTSILGNNSGNHIITNDVGQLVLFLDGTPKLFPVGNATYNPIMLSSSSSIGFVSVGVTDEAIINNENLSEYAVNRTWSLTEVDTGNPFEGEARFFWGTNDELTNFSKDIVYPVRAYNNELITPNATQIANDEGNGLYSAVYQGSIGGQFNLINRTLLETEFECALLAPNPTNDILNLSHLDKFVTAVSFKVTIINYTGQLVFEKIYDSFYDSVQMDVSHYPAGMYILTIETEREKCEGKFIKT